MRRNYQPSAGPRLQRTALRRTMTSGAPNTTLVLDRRPTMSLHFFENQGDVFVAYARNGTTHERPIDFDAVSEIFQGGGVTSGLLPQHVLATGQRNGQHFYVMYFPARPQITMYVNNRTYTIPTPPFVVAGRATDYRFFALPRKQRPTNVYTTLALPPLPNTYNDGRACWGSSWSAQNESIPLASPETIPKVLKRLLEESIFTHEHNPGRSKHYPDNLLLLWQELHTQKATTYPIDDLKNSGYTLNDLITGRIV